MQLWNRAAVLFAELYSSYQLVTATADEGHGWSNSVTTEFKKLFLNKNVIKSSNHLYESKLSVTVY